MNKSQSGTIFQDIYSEDSLQLNAQLYYTIIYSGYSCFYKTPVIYQQIS